MWTANFWKASGERAVRTFAQALLALLAVGQTTVLTVDWSQAGAVAATAALLSLLTSIVASGVGNTGPSFVNEATIPAAVNHAPLDVEIG